MRKIALHGVAGQGGGAHGPAHSFRFGLPGKALDVTQHGHAAIHNQRKDEDGDHHAAQKMAAFFFKASTSFLPAGDYRMLDTMPAMGSITDSSTAPMTMDNTATMVGSMMDTRWPTPSSTSSS